MSSETEHDIAKQPEPTCPMIDALQKKLRDAGFTASDARARYCSNRCRQAAKYQRAKAAKK